ncbi:hypothetical protein F7725_010177 [Dissostichus mawsoni]|uniref:Cadherin domain-containing protein n=1 Tax=Dissostichus mawsoni TaxID=36200 RepID=A0A7J5XPE2_DISMA|nr:hypothetical protein F7725_010177 [Dissostichus mawsoni]
MFHSNLPVIPYYPPRYSDTLGTGTLQHVYNYEVCRMTDSRKSDCKFGRAGSQNVLIMDPSSTGTMQRIQSQKNILDEPDSPLEVSYVGSVLGQVSYSIPEEMPSGSLVGAIAQDLGLDDSAGYIELNKDRGVLIIKDRINRGRFADRLRLIILENPMEFYSITVEITDINDNPPTFEKNERSMEETRKCQEQFGFV